MRPIDADALKEKINTAFLSEIGKLIDNAPTIDAVEVVRCKDCMFGKVYQNDSSGVESIWCKAFTTPRMVTDDDFCSYGERRDDD